MFREPSESAQIVICRVYMTCIIQESSVGHYVPLLYGLVLLPCTGRFIVQNVSASFDFSTVF